MRNATERWMLTTGLLVAIGIAAGVNLIVPRFEEAFQNFGAELPLLTRLFVETRYALFGLPLIVLAAWAWTPRRTPPGVYPARPGLSRIHSIDQPLETPKCNVAIPSKP